MGKDRDREAVQQVACPACGAPAGRMCRLTPREQAQADAQRRAIVHSARRQAWLAVRPRDALRADIVMSDQAVGPPGARDTYVLMAPLTARGRDVLPDGPTRVEHRDMRATLIALRRQGLIVMRED